jgi:hypothetical protein
MTLKEQYTPAISRSSLVGARCIEDSTVFALTRAGNKNHAPDGIGWMTDQLSWPTWDGMPFDTNGKNTKEICSFVFPRPNQMRGLRALFYDIKPFADDVRPTVAEIDAWNVQVIQHFRNLIGAPMLVMPDRCLFLRAQWNSERRFTRVWDTDYPADTCYGSTNEHCGATFLPSPVDQEPYLKGGVPCVNVAGAEGIFTVNKDLPWCIKMSRVIASTLCTEGLGGHTGPFVGRELVGLSFTCHALSQIVRVKFCCARVDYCTRPFGAKICRCAITCPT